MGAQLRLALVLLDLGALLGGDLAHFFETRSAISNNPFEPLPTLPVESRRSPHLQTPSNSTTLRLNEDGRYLFASKAGTENDKGEYQTTGDLLIITTADPSPSHTCPGHTGTYRWSSRNPTASPSTSSKTTTGRARGSSTGSHMSQPAEHQVDHLIRSKNAPI